MADFFQRGGGFPGTGLSSMDRKLNSNSVKKCRIGGMQDKRDAGQEGCMTGSMQERWDAGQERCRTGEMQDRRE